MHDRISLIGLVITSFLLSLVVGWTHLVHWPEYLIILAFVAAPISLLICYFFPAKEYTLNSPKLDYRKSFSHLLAIGIILAARLTDLFKAIFLLRVVWYFAAAILLFILIRAIWRKNFLSKVQATEVPIVEPTTAFVRDRSLSAANFIRFLFIVLLLMMSAVATNCWLDKSAAETLIAPIIQKNSDRDKRNNLYYTLVIRNPVRSPLPFSFSDNENLTESEMSYNLNIEGESYSSIVPNHTNVILKLHHGLLGMPWYEMKYTVRSN